MTAEQLLTALENSCTDRLVPYIDDDHSGWEVLTPAENGTYNTFGVAFSPIEALRLAYEVQP